MSRNPAHSDNAVFAVVHETGATGHVLVVRHDAPADAGAGRPPTVLEARTLADVRRGGDLEALLDTHRVSRVIRILPTSRVVCRTCTLPQAEPAQLEQALRLQAEANHLGDGGDHRMALAVVPAAPGETTRAGIVLSWPMHEAEPDLPALATRRPVTFAPDIAALAALLDRHRPADPVLWLDRRTASVALGLTHANGAVFRGTREEAESADAWRRQVTRVLAETALSVSHTGGFAEALVANASDAIGRMGPDDCLLRLPDEVVAGARTRLDGTGTDAGWWQDYGLAAGVALAAAGDFAALTLLQSRPEVREPSRIERLGAALARPRTALTTIIACLVLIGLIPLGVAGLRLGVFKLRYPDIEDRTAELNEAREQLAMYRALDAEAWCTTKLLADIVCNTPEGIELEMIRLQHADRSFAMSGSARPNDGREATEIVQLLQDNLDACRLFGEVNLNWGDRNAYGHYKFDLSAKIRAPHRRPRYDIAQDFGRWTLADRQAGDPPPSEDADAAPRAALARDGGADLAVTPVNDDDPAAVAPAPARPADPEGSADAVADAGGDEDPEGAQRSPNPGPDRFGFSRSNDSDAGESRSDTAVRGAEGGAAPGTIPEPLSEAQIKALSIEEVNQLLPKIAAARSRARRSGDTELSDRLKREFDQLMARKRGDA